MFIAAYKHNFYTLEGLDFVNKLTYSVAGGKYVGKYVEGLSLAALGHLCSFLVSCISYYYFLCIVPKL